VGNPDAMRRQGGIVAAEEFFTNKEIAGIWFNSRYNDNQYQ
jgi:hypothetical protein